MSQWENVCVRERETMKKKKIMHKRKNKKFDPHE